MARKTDDKSLVKETYAASLQPDKLAEFEKFWEAYIDSKTSGHVQSLDNNFLETHFSMALGIVERIRHNQNEDNFFHKTVMSYAGLAFVLSQGGDILSKNPDAEEILEDCTSLQSFFNEEDTDHLLRWMQGHQERMDCQKNPYLFYEVSWGNGTNATLFITPIEKPKDDLENMTTRQHYFLVSRVDLEVNEAVLPTLRESFSLSSAEASVTMHLANGQSVKRIAELRGTSELTVRSQVKQILAKTSARDIADLARIILSHTSTFNAVTKQTQRISESLNENSTTRVYNVILPDGRFMEYIEQGHPRGKPLLIMHCIVKGLRLTQAASEKALLNNWRIIIPLRAGFGSSDPNPKPTPQETVSAAVEDYKFLLDYLDIEKAPILTDWAGAFANQFAISYPDRVTGILQNTCIPLWRNSYLQFFKTRHRVIVKTSIFAPAAVPYMLRVAKALIDSGCGHLFVREMDEENESDHKALIRDPDTIRVMIESFETLYRQSVRPFSEELKVIHTDFSKRYADLKVPVTVLRGGDQMVPIKAFEEYKKYIPHANVKTVDGASIYLRFNYFERILSEIEEF